MIPEEISGEISGKTYHGGHRKIDVARDEDQHLAGSHDGEERRVHRQRRQIGHTQHAGVDRDHGDNNGDNGEDKSDLTLSGERLHPPDVKRRFGCPCRNILQACGGDSQGRPHWW